MSLQTYEDHATREPMTRSHGEFSRGPAGRDAIELARPDNPQHIDLGIAACSAACIEPEDGLKTNLVPRGDARPLEINVQSC